MRQKGILPIAMAGLTVIAGCTVQQHPRFYGRSEEVRFDVEAFDDRCASAGISLGKLLEKKALTLGEGKWYRAQLSNLQEVNYTNDTKLEYLEIIEDDFEKFSERLAE